MLSEISSVKEPDRQHHNYLTIPQAHVFLQSMGFTDLSLRQVVRWANERVLPFFRLGKRSYIDKGELIVAIKRRQLDAVKRSRR